LRRSRQLSETIAREDRTGHFLAIEIPRMRQNRCHAGAYVVAPNDRRMPNLDAVNIRDRIKRPGRQNANLYAQLQSTGMRVYGFVYVCGVAGARSLVLVLTSG